MGLTPSPGAAPPHHNQSNPLAVLQQDVMEAIRTAAARIYPGTPVLPTLETGASDGIYLSAQ